MLVFFPLGSVTVTVIFFIPDSLRDVVLGVVGSTQNTVTLRDQPVKPEMAPPVFDVGAASL